MSDSKRYRILSLDGGGIRGLMTAIWLKRLQDRLNEPLWKYFDLIAGTSTGAILACGISKGVEIDRVVDLYVKRGQDVFPAVASRLWRRAARLFSDGLSAPKYDGEGLDKALKDVFHTTLFGNLRVKPTLVTSYDAFSRRPVVFKNNDARYRDFRVWEVCRASASAPTYFPAHIMTIAGAEVPLIDGGVVANNPTACAIAEAVRVGGDPDAPDPCKIKDFIVASFGTGEAIRHITTEQATEWGLLEWAGPIVGVLFDGSADAVDYIARHLLGKKDYFRFQCRLDAAYDDLDDASQTNVNALVHLANEYIERPPVRDRLHELATRLERMRR